MNEGNSLDSSLYKLFYEKCNFSRCIIKKYFFNCIYDHIIAWVLYSVRNEHIKVCRLPFVLLALIYCFSNENP